MTEELSGSDEKSEYSAYILDQMQLVEQDPFEDDLVRTFKQMYDKKDTQLSYELQKKHKHLQPQFKVLVTPTMLVFEQAMYEEGNHMLRLHKDFQFHFLRVNFISNTKQTIFFND